MAKEKKLLMHESISKDRFEQFMEQLKSAMHLAGGGGGDWENKPLHEVFKDLDPNGIELRFVLSANFNFNKASGKEKSYGAWITRERLEEKFTDQEREQDVPAD